MNQAPIEPTTHAQPPAQDGLRSADAGVRNSQQLAALSLGALISLGLAWELWLAPTGSGTLAVKVVPLALALPGVLRARLYTFRWLSLLVWLYFAEGVVRAHTDRGLSCALGFAELALSLTLFIACAWHIRRRLRLAKA